MAGGSDDASAGSEGVSGEDGLEASCQDGIDGFFASDIMRDSGAKRKLRGIICESGECLEIY